MQDPTDVLSHILDLKTSVARLDERLRRIEVAVIGPSGDGVGGLQSRVGTLELDKARIRAIAGAAGLLGGLIGWLISHLPKGL